MACSSPLCLVLTAACITVLNAYTLATDSFVAAVYEHAPLGDLSNDSPAEIIRVNLDYFKRAAEEAANRHADIIVYPEYAIFPPYERKVLKNFLENTPDPKQVHTTPCDEYETYSDRPILYALSCMAKENSIVVVANTGDIQPCEGQPDCPEDGAFHYNTNLAFDKNGTLIAKYYKERLFFELSMDLPREEQDPIVETEFGTFAMFICFDIIYERMSKTAKMSEVDAILFSTMWLNSSPLYSSIQLFESWAKGHDATLLASNIQFPGYSAVGSGIFQGLTGAVAYSFNPDGMSKLIVARVSKSRRPPQRTRPSVIAILENGTSEYNTMFAPDIPEQCSYKLLGNASDPYQDFRCYEVNTQNYTLVKLTERRGRVDACNNGMCCSLNYSLESLDETFYLGVFNGTYTVDNRYSWEEENCFLARCDDLKGVPCATFPTRSNTVFYQAQLTANFSTEYIYPSVIKRKMRLIPNFYWTYTTDSEVENKRTINFDSPPGQELLQIALKARAYQRDPPYER